MLIPMVCFSCNQRVGYMYPRYCALLSSGAKPPEALAAVGATAICCRRMLLSSTRLENVLTAQDDAGVYNVTVHSSPLVPSTLEAI